MKRKALSGKQVRTGEAEARQKRLAALREDLRANSLRQLPKVKLVLRTQMQRKISSVVEKTLRRLGYGEAEISRAKRICYTINDLYRQVEAVSTLMLSKNMKQLQGTPKMQERHQNAKGDYASRYFELLDGTRSTEEAARIAAQEFGLDKMELEIFRKFQDYFESTGYDLKNVPPNLIKAFPIDLKRYAWDVMRRKLNKLSDERNELMKALGSFENETYLIRELEKISGFELVTGGQTAGRGI